MEYKSRHTLREHVLRYHLDRTPLKGNVELKLLKRKITTRKVEQPASGTDHREHVVDDHKSHIAAVSMASPTVSRPRNSFLQRLTESGHQAAPAHRKEPLTEDFWSEGSSDDRVSVEDIPYRPRYWYKSGWSVSGPAHDLHFKRG
ncbi:hypothetical protein OHC33_004268 [Knufia fluminis]|uniref:Uncharacterized protein n=1 Tax=Knufia fluminis TaxID=191047 RepID=A0AAN8I8F9_9EURO|nr:hypothetical protein OHC33_004268 [Knufia fluminis]